MRPDRRSLRPGVTVVRRILLVDDEYLLAACLADILEEEGYDVDIAVNGAAALAMMRDLAPDLAPDLVVTDFMMPEMTGLEMATALRDDPAFQAIPIILVSGAQGEIARQRDDLFRVVLDKPFPIERLLDEIRAVFAGLRP